ncbi:MAG: RNA polymerase subunit sigma-70, partial [Butyrivibrio sp.]|nr:RNA polymerase subunit sigma-70 [Butyrivibrio sp.]
MDDNGIIQLYWDRNEQAIKQTSEKYGHYCKYIAKNILNNDEDAE